MEQDKACARGQLGLIILQFPFRKNFFMISDNSMKSLEDCCAAVVPRGPLKNKRNLFQQLEDKANELNLFV